MIVYRIGKTKHAHDLTGEGARLFGGRWKQKLTPCIYTSESRALAVLEYTVNVNIDDIPRALSITTLNIPDHSVKEIKITELPGDWAAVPSPAHYSCCRSAEGPYRSSSFTQSLFSFPLKTPSPFFKYSHVYVTNRHAYQIFQHGHGIWLKHFKKDKW